MKMKMKIAAALTGAAVAATVAAVPANAGTYTRGGDVQVRLVWHGARCTTIQWPKGPQWVCGGGDEYTAEYRVTQGPITYGDRFGAAVHLATGVESAYCEVVDVATGNIVTNDFSFYMSANCLQNAR